MNLNRAAIDAGRPYEVPGLAIHGISENGQQEITDPVVERANGENQTQPDNRGESECDFCASRHTSFYLIAGL